MSSPRSGRRPVAVLTAAFGDGHNSAANGIAAALVARGREVAGPHDLLREAYPSLMHVLSSGYRHLITHWPWAWRALYGAADRIPLGNESPDVFPAATRAMANYLDRIRPQMVVSTYPLYGHLIERLFGPAPLPFSLLTMVTDSTSINHSWINSAAGHYAVADEQSAQYFHDAGLPTGRVHVTGFPVDPGFGCGRPDRAERQLPTPFRILYLPTTAAGSVVRTLAGLSEFIAAAQFEVQLTVVLGRHEKRLRKRVQHAVPAGSEVLGWTGRMAELLSSSHLLISKAGGASVQEALASGCPMLVDYVVPGQEEGNAERLVGLGAGAVAPTPDRLADYLSEITGSGGAWLSMRRAAIKSGSAGAALRVADLSLTLEEMASRVSTS